MGFVFYVPGAKNPHHMLPRLRRDPAVAHRAAASRPSSLGASETLSPVPCSLVPRRALSQQAADLWLYATLQRRPTRKGGAVGDQPRWRSQRPAPLRTVPQRPRGPVSPQHATTPADQTGRGCCQPGAFLPAFSLGSTCAPPVRNRASRLPTLCSRHRFPSQPASHGTRTNEGLPLLPKPESPDALYTANLLRCLASRAHFPSLPCTGFLPPRRWKGGVLKLGAAEVLMVDWQRSCSITG